MTKQALFDLALFIFAVLSIPLATLSHFMLGF
jgi:hypothetical protein